MNYTRSIISSIHLRMKENENHGYIITQKATNKTYIKPEKVVISAGYLFYINMFFHQNVMLNDRMIAVFEQSLTFPLKTKCNYRTCLIDNITSSKACITDCLKSNVQTTN
jgi:hypothetical protein